MLVFFAVVFLGSLKGQLPICEYSPSGQFLGTTGCYNLTPTFQWIDRSIISIFLVFMIAFLPLFLQGALFIYHQSRGVLNCFFLLQNSWSVELARQSFDSQNISARRRRLSKSSRRRSPPIPSRRTSRSVGLGTSLLVVGLRRLGCHFASSIPDSLDQVFTWE